MQLCGRAAADVLSGPDSCRHARESAQGIDRLSCFLHSTVPLSSFQVWMHVVPWGPVGAGGRGGGGGGVCVCVCVYTRMCACMRARLSMRVYLCGLGAYGNDAVTDLCADLLLDDLLELGEEHRDNLCDREDLRLAAHHHLFASHH